MRADNYIILCISIDAFRPNLRSAVYRDFSPCKPLVLIYHIWYNVYVYTLLRVSFARADTISVQ